MEAVRPSHRLPPYRHEKKLTYRESIPVDVAPVPLPAGLLLGLIVLIVLTDLAAIRRHRPNDIPA
jgi:hypothetical protein